MKVKRYYFLSALMVSIILHLTMLVTPGMLLAPFKLPTPSVLKPLSVKLQPMVLSDTNSPPAAPATHNLSIISSLTPAPKRPKRRPATTHTQHAKQDSSSAQAKAITPKVASLPIDAIAANPITPLEHIDPSAPLGLAPALGPSEASAPSATMPAAQEAESLATASADTRPESADSDTAAPAVHQAASDGTTSADTATATDAVNQQASAGTTHEPAPSNSSAALAVTPKRPSAAHTTLAHFPNQARISYQVLYGSLVAGTATLDWQRTGSRYSLESVIQPIIGPQLRYTSAGSIGRAGLKPKTFFAWHNQTAREYARFNWKTKQLEYGDTEVKHATLRAGAQDIFSVLYQLALKGAPPEGQSTQVTTGKKVRDYALAAVGEADFASGNGVLRAIVIRSQEAEGLTEFWLAPDFANQPIRVKRIDSALKLELRATQIILNHHIEWQLPPPRKTKQ